MADAERIDEAFQRNLPPRLDRFVEIADRNLAVTLDLLEIDLLVALAEREDVGRLLDPALLVEQHDLLLAEAFDVEGAARHEMPQVFHALERTGELAGAVGAGALLAAGNHLADHV